MSGVSRSIITTFIDVDDNNNSSISSIFAKLETLASFGDNKVGLAWLAWGNWAQSRA